ncbi:uncharacterized protein ACA1_235420 [Acanthamoeba castellanii str. Neff]|uniref:Uncharacterized protein n=1 Tax=Acanthamoeba castellanii (strain ATCC 30010 / Neff) TaxID=1257118 RepID=L8H0K4_ACACF|nr:uncharacterized protein ACA1_235420 [Acanthamoeba castellanii str. Neff]ELR19024.1 hypothetical protein ACA1_235420 [Acanthamoeba castellanii str. Neff]
MDLRLRAVGLWRVEVHGQPGDGFYSISSVTYYLSHRSGSSSQVSAVIIGGNSLIASVDISSPLPSGYGPVQATFDHAATYLAAFYATGAGDGQSNVWIDLVGDATGFCYSSITDCVSNIANRGLASNVLGTIMQRCCTAPSPSSTRTPSPSPSPTRTACGPGANTNGTVVGVYGYGGWSADAARCLGNKVTGYHSISSVTFFFSHSNGWRMR